MFRSLFIIFILSPVFSSDQLFFIINGKKICSNSVRNSRFPGPHRNVTNTDDFLKCDEICSRNHILSPTRGCVCQSTHSVGEQCEKMICLLGKDAYCRKYAHFLDYTDCNDEFANLTASKKLFHYELKQCSCENGFLSETGDFCHCNQNYYGRFCENYEAPLEKKTRSIPLHTKLMMAIAIKITFFGMVAALYIRRKRSGSQMVAWATPKLHTYRRRRLRTLVHDMRGRRAGPAVPVPVSDNGESESFMGNQNTGPAYDRTVPAPSYERIMNETPPPSYQQAILAQGPKKSNRSYGPIGQL